MSIYNKKKYSFLLNYLHCLHKTITNPFICRIKLLKRLNSALLNAFYEVNSKYNNTKEYKCNLGNCAKKAEELI